MADMTALIVATRALRVEHPAMGAKQLTRHLRAEQWYVDTKRVREALRQLDVPPETATALTTTSGSRAELHAALVKAILRRSAARVAKLLQDATAGDRTMVLAGSEDPNAPLLCMCIETGQADMVCMLLEHRADCDAKIRRRDDGKKGLPLIESTLGLACRAQGNRSIVEGLLAAGATTRGTGEYDSPLRIAPCWVATVNHRMLG